MQQWQRSEHEDRWGKGLVFQIGDAKPQLLAWTVEEGAGPHHADGLAVLAAEHGEHGYKLIACFGITPGGIVKVYDETRGTEIEELIPRLNPGLKPPERIDWDNLGDS